MSTWLILQKYSICIIECVCYVGFMYLLVDIGSNTTHNQPAKTISNWFENKRFIHSKQLIKKLQMDTKSNRISRSKLDGAWVGSSNPIEIYGYSAFYDDRASLKSRPVVRVIVVTEVSNKTPLYCFIQYGKKSGVHTLAKRLGM